ncbi:MAG: Glycosyl transferase, group 1 [Candidatus Moranbacteria bacterium GW2011_GWA2_39_41]|nr:MAG: Glycosyl transferase, group 1 [Candidatus Moranbacteria bacterium GW2011_GWA2_39_41]
MKIAISVADLDQSRVDGTRVYILNLLKHFGQLDFDSEFLLYHKNDFNPELTPPNFLNYKIIQKSFPFLWTQIRLAMELWKDVPDVLWMPMAALPLVRRKNLKTVITIHDLAFKHFPQYFTKKDLRKLNFFADYSVRNASKIIAVSQSTKQDILKFYPEVKEDKIKVIYHGFTDGVFSQARDLTQEEKVKNELGIVGDYILYSGALQPRKNIERLIEAFDAYKTRSKSAVKLVLAGEKAWLCENIEKKAKRSLYSADIVMPGRLRFCDIGHLFRGAALFAHPSLYEGFGITVLEAYAAGVPLLTADNSSLREAGGEAALYFDAYDVCEMSAQMERLLTDEKLRTELIAKGKEQLQKFSWEKCAKETLGYIKTS